MTYTQSKRYIRFFTSFLFFLGLSCAKAQYCEPSGGGDTNDDWLAAVEFADIDHSSGSTVYSDFTYIVGNVSAGVSYEFIGTIGNSATWNQYLTVYIDFNQDEDFDELTERFDLGSCNWNECTIAGEILIPSNAAQGSTRMRVIENYINYTSSACEQSLFSEVEDYTLNISSDCLPLAFLYEFNHDCDANTFGVSATLNDFAGNSAVTFAYYGSDIGYDGSITVTDDMVGQTVDLLTDIPLWVNVTVSIEGDDTACTTSTTWSSVGDCPPINDVCETAISVNGLDSAIPGTTIGASPVTCGIELCPGYSNTEAPAVWYSYTSGGFGSAWLSLASVDFSARIYVFEGPCDDLTCIGTSNGDFLSWGIRAGRKYYILVTGEGAASGNFELNVDAATVDDCAYPNVTTTMVDENESEITECLQVGDTYYVQVHIHPFYIDEPFNVQVGDITADVIQSESHIFGPFDAGENTPVSISPSPIYGEHCGISLLVESDFCPPENDHCTEAITLACGEEYSGTTSGATDYHGQEYCGISPPSCSIGGVWHMFTVENPTLVEADLSGSEFDTKMWLYSGSCGELNCLLSDDNGGAGSTSKISMTLTTGTYYIYISGSGTETGNYTLNLSCAGLECIPDMSVAPVNADSSVIEGCIEINGEYFVSVSVSGGEADAIYDITVNGEAYGAVSENSPVIVGPFEAVVEADVLVANQSNSLCNSMSSLSVENCPPSNDVCSMAIPLDCYYVPISGSTINASYTPEGISFCDGFSIPESPSVWYKASTSDYTTFILNITSDEFNPQVYIFKGSCDNLKYVNSFSDDLTLYGERDVTYYFMVTGSWPSQAGSFELVADCYSLLWECPEYDTRLVDENGDEISSCISAEDEYWVEVSISEMSYLPTPFIVYVHGNSIEMDLGETHVFGPFGAGLEGNVNVQDMYGSGCVAWTSIEPDICSPSNMDCPSAQEIACGETTSGTNLCANPVPNDLVSCLNFPGSNAGAVWYQVSSETNALVDVGVSSISGPNSMNPQFLILEGACGTYSCIGNSNTSNMVFQATAGETYYIVVTGLGTSEGVFEITVDCDPFLFPCDAISLDCGAYETGSNIFAPESMGCNNQLRQTVWYTYTAPANGTVFLTTCNPETNFDTDISMYTGTCDGELTCFEGWGGNGYIDGPPSCPHEPWASEGSFDVEAGTTYFIAVSGYYDVGDPASWEGEFALSLTCMLDETSTLNGTVDWDASCGEKTISIDFYSPGTDMLTSTHNTIINSDGSFSIQDVAVGTFDMVVKVDGYLAASWQGFEINADSNTIEIDNLMAGDVNGDNVINILDVSLMNAAFGSSTGDANFNELADSNCDGGVNIQDVSTINAGFGQSGASVPMP